MDSSTFKSWPGNPKWCWLWNQFPNSDVRLTLYHLMYSQQAARANSYTCDKSFSYELIFPLSWKDFLFFFMTGSFAGKWIQKQAPKPQLGPLPLPDHSLLCLMHESQAEAKYTQCGLDAGKRLRAPDMGWINTQSLFLHRVHWLFLRMVPYWSGNMFTGMFTLIFNDFLLHILTLPHFGCPQSAVVRLHSRLYCESEVVDSLYSFPLV